MKICSLGFWDIRVCDITGVDITKFKVYIYIILFIDCVDYMINVVHIGLKTWMLMTSVAHTF